ncbi:hypothetical protein HaLaN_27859, partial [Haematococcus lacustris]
LPQLPAGLERASAVQPSTIDAALVYIPKVTLGDSVDICGLLFNPTLRRLVCAARACGKNGMLNLTPFGAGGLATSSVRQGCGAVQALQKPVDRSTSKRRQQLVELGDGWGVSVVPSPASPPQPSGSLAVQEAMLQPTTALEGADAGWGVSTTEPTASSSGRAAKPVPKKRVAKATPRSPYMNITSEQGMMSLALLQARLASKDVLQAAALPTAGRGSHDA